MCADVASRLVRFPSLKIDSMEALNKPIFSGLALLQIEWHLPFTFIMELRGSGYNGVCKIKQNEILNSLQSKNKET